MLIISKITEWCLIAQYRFESNCHTKKRCSTVSWLRLSLILNVFLDFSPAAKIHTLRMKFPIHANHASSLDEASARRCTVLLTAYGCVVIDEPMWGVWRIRPGSPWKKETLVQWPTTIEGCVTSCCALFLRRDLPKKYGASHGWRPWYWVEPSACVFWIRHPHKVVRNTQVIDTMSPFDIGLNIDEERWVQLSQFPALKSRSSDEMLANPAKNVPLIWGLRLAPTRGNASGHRAEAYDGPWWRIGTPTSTRAGLWSG